MGRKKLPVIIGVYMIKCEPNGKIYIGYSKDIYKRWNAHRNKTPNNVMVQDVIKFGGDNFKFSIIEECETEAIAKEREIHYMQLHQSYKRENGYNVRYDNY